MVKTPERITGFPLSAIRGAILAQKVDLSETDAYFCLSQMENRDLLIFLIYISAGACRLVS